MKRAGPEREGNEMFVAYCIGGDDHDDERAAYCDLYYYSIRALDRLALFRN